MTHKNEHAKPITEVIADARKDAHSRASNPAEAERLFEEACNRMVDEIPICESCGENVADRGMLCSECELVEGREYVCRGRRCRILGLDADPTAKVWIVWSDDPDRDAFVGREEIGGAR